MIKILGICLLIFIAFCLFSIWHSSTHFHKVTYRLSSDKLKKPVKLVLLADLHNQEFGKDNIDLLRAIEKEEPDAILAAGDILTAYTDEEPKAAVRFMEALGAGYTVYYGLGNHEAKMQWSQEKFGDAYNKYMTALRRAGIKVLKDSWLDLQDTQIRIYGLDLEQKYYQRFHKEPLDDRYLEEKLGRPSKENYNILIAHNPAYFETYAAWSPDLVVSGHVHGGLIRLPFLGGVFSPSISLFPKYDGGKFTAGNTTMLLSRGLSYHGIALRMWNPGELIIIELTPEG